MDQPTSTVPPRTRRRSPRPAWVRRCRAVLGRIPGWAISVSLHLLLLWLFLGLVHSVPEPEPPTFLVTLGDPDGGRKGLDLGALGKDDEEPPQQEETRETESPVDPMPDPMPEKEPRLALGAVQESSAPASGTPGAYQGRGGAGRGDALRRYGGTEESERAVADGLRWLLRHQSPDGSWRGAGWSRQCPRGDRCSGPSQDEFTPGFTGLSLLCFLGAGHTHIQGDHADAVGRGLAWLRRKQAPDGSFCGPSWADGYSQAICTLALSEAYALTGNLELARMAQKGLHHMARMQQPGGGWDYKPPPTGRDDMSIHGWAVAALRSARLSGIPFDREMWEKARDAFVRCAADAGRLTYSNKVIYADSPIPCGEPSYCWESLTPVGLLIRTYLDVPGEDPRTAAIQRMFAFLPQASKPAVGHDQWYDPGAFYYYGSMALFHRGGDDWRRWNAVVRDRLVGTQSGQGHARGSWDPLAGWLGREAGRLYATCLALLTLEVYYRYLPLYAEENTSPPATRDFLTLPSADLAAATAEISSVLAGAAQAAAAGLADLIAELEEEGDPEGRLLAARRLAEDGVVAAAPAFHRLIDALPDTSKPVYIELLSRLRAPESVDFLAKLLDHGSARVRQSALLALRRISGNSREADVRSWLKARAAPAASK